VRGHIKDIELDARSFDICLLGSVLLHLRDPLSAFEKMLNFSENYVVVTELVPDRIFPFFDKFFVFICRKTQKWPTVMRLLPSKDSPHDFAWWMFSPKTLVNFASLFGFESEKILYHKGKHKGADILLYTIVLRRKK
jgi:hypothetical protein